MNIVHSSLIFEDLENLDLNISIVKKEKKEDVFKTLLYFTVAKLEDGDLRAFMKIIKKDSTQNHVIFIRDPLNKNESNNEDIYRFFLDNDIGIIEIDYTGDVLQAHHTMYPQSIEFCNFDKNNMQETYDDIKKSCWYYWTLIFLQGIRVLEELDVQKYGIIGLGLSGVQVIRLMALSQDIAFGMIIGDCGFKFKKESDENYLTYFAAFDNTSFVKMIKQPIIISIGTNIENFEYMALLYDLLLCTKQIIIKPNSIDCNFLGAEFLKKVFEGISFNDAKLKAYYNFGGEKKFEQNEKENIKNKLSKIKNIEFVLSCSFNNYDPKEKIEKVEFFYSNSVSDFVFKYWSRLETEKLSDRMYSAVLDKFNNANILCFAIVTYANGMRNASNILRLNFDKEDILELGAKEHQFFSCDYDTDCFTSEGKIFIEKGPYDLLGFGSDNANIQTYKIGDESFRYDGNSAMQMLIFSSEQNIKITIESVHHVMYSIKKIIPLSKTWTKITILPNELISDKGALDTWDQAGSLSIIGEKKFLLNSILWV